MALSLNTDIDRTQLMVAEEQANPFLSALGNFGVNIITTATGVVSKATETAVDAAGLALQNKIVGSVSPTGATSPETAAAQAQATAAAAAQSASWQKYALPVAAGLAAVLIVVLAVSHFKKS